MNLTHILLDNRGAIVAGAIADLIAAKTGQVKVAEPPTRETHARKGQRRFSADAHTQRATA